MSIKILKKANSNLDKALTLRQEAVVSIVANRRKMGSKAGILREAGYSESTIRHPDRVFNSPKVIESIRPVISQMWRIRNEVLNVLEKKSFDKESSLHLVFMISALTKNLEILESRPTPREEYQLSEEEKARLRRLVAMNSKCRNCGE